MKLETLWVNEFGNTQTSCDCAGRKINRSEQGKKTTHGWDRDHIQPLSKNGPDNVENMQIVHWKTNDEKANRTSFNISGEYGGNSGNYQIKRINKTTPEERKKIPYDYSKKKYAVVKLENNEGSDL